MTFVPRGRLCHHEGRCFLTLSEAHLEAAHQQAMIAEEHSAEAIKTAEEFRLGIVKANQIATESMTKTEEARLANAQLEKKLDARKLSDEQMLLIADMLKKFPGQEFGITTYWDMKEPLALANRIYNLLNFAQWKFIKPANSTFLLGGTEGVLVFVHPEANEQAKKATEALVKALNKEGIEAEIRHQNAPNSPTNTIQLNVGTKS
jgi:hypothetical protein